MEYVQKVLPVEAEYMLRIPCRLHQNDLMHCGSTTWKYIFWAWLIHVTFHGTQDGRLLATIGEDCALKLFEAKRIVDGDGYHCTVIFLIDNVDGFF